jgi:hypothetical protein
MSEDGFDFDTQHRRITAAQSVGDPMLVALLRAQMDAALDNARRDLNAQLYTLPACTVTTMRPPSLMKRIARRVRWYLYGWRDALACVYRAALGRDVIPPCEHEDW